MPKGNRKGNAWRFLGLGALTAASVAGMSTAFKAMSSVEELPEVDALLTPPPGGGEWPFVSIVVPARNEERNLSRLLPSLLSQRYPNYEVIVVDDQSEDATYRILTEWAARDPRLKVVHGAPLPREEGWLGKPHAMAQGAEAAKGSWLLFTDADTRHEPYALGSTVSFALSHRVDLLTILPCYDLVTPAERIVMPVIFQGIMSLYPPQKVNDPTDSAALANGQYILIDREVYQAVGGVERVKSRITEDLEFAKVVKGEGYRLYMVDGRNIMSVRMYTNLAEIWEGWSKNTVIALRENPRTAPLAALGLFVLTALPFILLRWALASWKAARAGGRPGDYLAAAWTTALTAFNLGTYMGVRRRVDTILGLPPGWALTEPIGAGISALIVLYSIVRLATGRGVVWKGRTYHQG